MTRLDARVCQFCFRTYLPHDARQRYCQTDCALTHEGIARRQAALSSVVDEWPKGFVQVVPVDKGSVKLLMQER